MPVNPRFDHVGLTVADLDEAVRFFVALGLEEEGRTEIRGEFIDTVCGLPGAHTEVVMLRPPGGGTGIELGRFLSPEHLPGSPDAMANVLGIRNACFEVDDVPAAVGRAEELGYGLVGGIGEYERTWQMAYVRGPEGIVVSVTGRIG